MNKEQQLTIQSEHDITGDAPTAPVAPGMQTLVEQLQQIHALSLNGSEQVGDLTREKLPWERRYQLSLAGASIALEHSVAPAGRELEGSEIARRMERDGVVKEAPDFKDQILDNTRVNRFSYSRSNRSAGSTREMTEHEGLQDLHTFLTTFLRLPKWRVASLGNKGKYERDLNRAQSMLENLTFIGEKELQEAAEGLGAYWKDYLDGDPARQVCVLAETNSLPRYDGKRKSDDFIRDRVLQTFSFDELKAYSGRIVGSMDDLSAAPQDAKVVLLDDWTISGQQIRDVHEMLSKDEKFREYDTAGSVEVNLVVADRDRLSIGLAKDPEDKDRGFMKVRSYFMSHHSDYVSKEGQSNLASTHSTPDGDFKNTLQGISSRYGRFGLSLPKLAKLRKTYQIQPRMVDIEGDTLTRHGL